MSGTDNNVHFKFYQALSQSSDIRTFLRENVDIDESRIILSRELFGVPSTLIANQITGRRKAKSKLPRYFEMENILYPPGVNLEQSSSEKTAELKSAILVRACEGRTFRVADLSGGFGVDSFFFSTRFDHVDYVDPDSVLAWLARHNHHQLGAEGITYHVETAEEFLSRQATIYNAAYIDPSRRSNSRKVIRLEECEPNIIALQQRIFELTEVLLIKTSPLLDITSALRALSSVHAVYVVSVDQECRELLFLCRRNFREEPRIHTVHLNKDTVETFDFFLTDERALEMTTGPVKKYLYEPNPSIMKAGAFKSLARAYDAPKLHPNSNFMSSDEFYSDFPGRVFEVVDRVSSRSKELKVMLPDMKANVVTRNYPLSANQLRKKLRLADGGTDYIIGTSSLKDGKLVLLARRLR